MSTETVYTTTLYDQHGYLTVLDRALTFMDGRTRALTELEPEMLPFLAPPVALSAGFSRYLRRQMRGEHSYITTMGE